MPTRKALLVGMNHYPNPRNELPSCENDAHRFHDLLTSEYGFAPENCRLRLSQPSDQVPNPPDNVASKKNILTQLSWLFSGASPGDLLVFYYSGHGYRTTTADGVLRDCICLYDNFLFGNEFSQLTSQVPAGTLTVVLDSCFSGGMDKAFFIPYSGDAQDAGVVRNKFFWADADQASKDFLDQLRPIPYASFGGPVVHPPRPLLLEEATKLFQREKAFVTSAGLSAADVVDKDMDQQLNGLLITACNAEEKAAASTPATGGLSAFTYCLMSAWTAMRTTRAIDQIVTSSLHADAGNRLRALNLTQTPLVKEPPVPLGLASRSFVTLQAVAPVPATAPTAGPATSIGQGGGSLSIDELVRMVLANIGHTGKGVSKGGDAVPTATATAPAAVGTLPTMDDKGFWDYFNRIAPVALQLVGTLSKEYEAGGKAMSTATVDIPSAADKGFWDYFNKIAPVALQVISSLTGGKAFEAPAPSTSGPAAPVMDEKGFWDYFNKIAPVAVQILGQLTKSYDTSTKSFTATATKGVVTLDDIPPPDDKGFWDVFRSVAQVAVPLIVSAL